MKTGILLLLSAAAASDLKTRNIPVIPVTLFAAALLGVRFLYFHQDVSPAAFLAGAVPGVLLFLISIVSRGAAGSGDALLLLLLGLIAGFWDALMICFLALVLTGFSGLGLMAAGKAGRRTKLPFVPFLLISYVLLLASGFLEIT